MSLLKVSGGALEGNDKGKKKKFPEEIESNSWLSQKKKSENDVKGYKLLRGSM